MKIIILVIFSLVFAFSSQEGSAETEMTGWLKVNDVFGPEPVPHSYEFWFEDLEKNNYRLNPNTLPPQILDLAGEKVRIKINDSAGLIAESLESNEQFVNVISIEKFNTSTGSSSLEVPATWRSITLLSKFNDVPATPSEDPISFNLPQGVALDSVGNVYVADSNNHQIQKFNANGDFLEEIGSLCQLSSGTGCVDPDGIGPRELGDGQFVFPSGITVDNSNNFYVVDNNNNRVQKFNSAGEFLFKLGANGGSDGSSGQGDGEFLFPFGVATDSLGNSYVADYNNNRIQKFNSTGAFQGWMGRCTSGVNCDIPNTKSNGFSCDDASCVLPGAGSNGNGHFFGPRDVAIDGSDNIYVVESNGNRVQKFDSSGNFLLKFGTGGTGNSQFSLPLGISVDNSNIYVADSSNNRVQKFNSTGGFVLKFGANGGDGTSGSGDGEFNLNEGIAMDASNNLFVGDKINNRIQKFNSTGGFISKIDTSPGQVHDASYYETLFYNGTGSLKQFYNVTSYGKFTLDGSVNGWKELPSNQATYIENQPLMLSDSLALHDIDVDFCNPTEVTNIILVFNEDIFSVTSAKGSLNQWGAPIPMGDGCSIEVTVIWNPDLGAGFCCSPTYDGGTGVTGHEIGHNLGRAHTPPPPGNWINGMGGPFDDPYHDPNSLMSRSSSLDGPSTLITGQRDEIGWMSAGNIISVPDGTSNTITLDFVNEPEGGPNPQMIKMPLANGNSYIVEGHESEQFNNTPQGKAGAIVYNYFPLGNQYAYLDLQSNKNANYTLVATAGTETESDFKEAILELNESYEDVANSVTVMTQAINSTSVTVFVSNNAGSTCAPQSGQNWVIDESCILTGNVTADMNITVQNNSVLTIPNGTTLFFDPGTFKITVISGSGILVEQGGSIQTTPP